MVGPRSWVGGLFNRTSNKRNEKFSDYPLSPLQEALRALWHAAFPNIALKGLISEQWKEMGWQGPNPSTDFR
uniref:ELMO domain-containing protein n=1 Tax=Fagus sylvatica TaxID=28930 RepID=A0A2N9EW89_FAGSY